MALSEMTARKAKPKTKPFKLYDEGVQHHDPPVCKNSQCEFFVKICVM